jgi:hypothetical protein
MGSSASIKLKCPKDYDKDNFAMILKLYDHLDRNGDQVIETMELKDIANLHINNNITEISNLKIKENDDYKYKLEKAKLKYEKNKADLKLLHEETIEKITNSHKINDDGIVAKINNLNNLTKEQKCLTFLKVVSCDGIHIEFWKFFEYMKNRTGDIKNISFE